MKTKLSFLILAALISPGCVTVTDPVAMGDDRYMITLNARGGFRSDGELLSQSIKNANAFCAAKEMQAEVLTTQTTGVQMWTPQNNQVVFKCVAVPPQGNPSSPPSLE